MPKLHDPIRFCAAALRPGGRDKGAAWAFVRLPAEASRKLPSRGPVSVEGALEGVPFQTTLEPDGEGGHWMKVGQGLLEASGVRPGEEAGFVVAPASEEPEPAVPPDLRQALDADPGASAAWAAITPRARRDWIHWATSAKRAETRAIRIGKACSMLAGGKRRPCCFDRSGMYGEGLGPPVPDCED
jgi:hypothetical protein